MNRLNPDFRFKALEDIDTVFLKGQGISGIVVDLDNTIVAWRKEELPTEIEDWFAKIIAAGIKCVLVSNAGGPRARRMSAKLDIPVIAPARKPLRSGFQKAITMLGMKSDHIACIGDQIFTDVLGGNKVGLTTILVEPVSRQEFVMTKIVRRIEKRFRGKV